MRELVHVTHDFDFDDILIFEHFYDAIINVDRIVNKIVTKKIKKVFRSWIKNFASCVLVNDLNDDNDNDNNNERDLFFRLCLARFNEWMTTTYVANVASNNHLIVVMKNVNVLKKVELLKIVMLIEIVVEREKTIEKKTKKTKKMTKMTRKNCLMLSTWRKYTTLIYFCKKINLS